MVLEASRIIVKQAHSGRQDEAAAIAELAAELDVAQASIVMFFCSPSYDLEKLAQALAANIAAPVVGCTSAGQISRLGYVDGGITAVSITSSELRATPYLISSLTDSTQATEVGYAAAVQLARVSARRGFGLLLIDGLSGAEERIAATLFETLGDVPIIGGSAANELAANSAQVYFEGRFHDQSAVFVLCDTTLPFATFKVQHVNPGSKKLVITEADADRRIVYEINGKLAAREYAAQIGLDLAELDPAVCAEHPLLLTISGEHFVRGVRSVNSDGSLSFFCAIEAGLVLTLGEPGSPLEALESGFAAAARQVRSPQVVIGFDCFLRRREFERAGMARAVSQFLAGHQVVGFSTFGEQYDALHVNQTFTAVVIGS